MNLKFQCKYGVQVWGTVEAVNILHKVRGPLKNQGEEEIGSSFTPHTPFPHNWCYMAPGGQLTGSVVNQTVFLFMYKLSFSLCINRHFSVGLRSPISSWDPYPLSVVSLPYWKSWSPQICCLQYDCSPVHMLFTNCVQCTLDCSLYVDWVILMLCWTHVWFTFDWNPSLIQVLVLWYSIKWSHIGFFLQTEKYIWI